MRIGGAKSRIWRGRARGCLGREQLQQGLKLGQIFAVFGQENHGAAGGMQTRGQQRPGGRVPPDYFHRAGYGPGA